MGRKGRYTDRLLCNADKINALRARIYETAKHRDESQEKLEEWRQACVEYQAQYDILAFPGGFNGAYERIVAGNPEAVEAAICFLECRPYFFRSGYMFKDIIRIIKRVPLTKAQAERLDKVLKAYDSYKKLKRK